MTEYTKTVNFILNTKKCNNLKDLIWMSFMGQKHKQTSKLKIALLNAPCYGFGDVIFAQKLKQYLLQWYDCSVKIFTTLPDYHKKLGEKSINLIPAVINRENQCRRFTNLTFNGEEKKKFDLYLVAPLVQEYEPELSKIKNTFKYANKYNTFFFSEYNSGIIRNFDFATGIGKGRYGLLLTQVNPSARIIKNPYAFMYIASGDHIPNSKKCYSSFLNMIVNKYKYKIFEIVAPNWIIQQILSAEYDCDKILQIYKTIIVVTKHNRHVIHRGSGRTIIFRGDIFPVANSDMLSLMKYSVRDILVTGDQSMTDVLSCCADKNMFYQIAPWKASLGRQLGKKLPNEFLLRKKTSCGSLTAIKYNSDYKNFIKTWDFRKLAKPKLDAICMSICAIKNDHRFLDLQVKINSKRKLTTLKQSLR
jgi:hypothetical protein